MQLLSGQTYAHSLFNLLLCSSTNLLRQQSQSTCRINSASFADHLHQITLSFYFLYIPCHTVRLRIAVLCLLSLRVLSLVSLPSCLDLRDSCSFPTFTCFPLPALCSHSYHTMPLQVDTVEEEKPRHFRGRAFLRLGHIISDTLPSSTPVLSSVNGFAQALLSECDVSLS